MKTKEEMAHIASLGAREGTNYVYKPNSIKLLARSESESVLKMLSALSGHMSAIESMDEETGYDVRGVAPMFQRAFEHAANYWAVNLGEAVDSLARSNKGFPHTHWTRHLYTGGNPAYTGNPRSRNFSTVGTGTSSGMKVQFYVNPDGGKAWSPIRETIKRAGSPKGRVNYDPWKKRTDFIMGTYGDLKGLYGSRSDADLKNPLKPLYIIGKGSGSETGYNIGREFFTDYTAVKAERDKDLRALTQGFTATQVLSRLDRDLRSTINSVVKDAFTGAKALERKIVAARNAGQISRGRPGTFRMSNSGYDVGKFSVSGGKGGTYAPNNNEAKEAAWRMARSFEGSLAKW